MKSGNELAERLRLTLVISRGEASPRTITELAEAAFAGGVTALQLREKNTSDQAFYDLARKLKTFCHDHGKLLIINDRLDIALAAEADGLHLGQSDLPAEIAAGLLPKNKILGVSANTVEAAMKAKQAGADYLGLGAVFPTGSKDDASVVSAETMAEIISLGLPTVAIGGINTDNAARVWRQGVSGLAVISALAASADPRATAARLLEDAVFSASQQ